MAEGATYAVVLFARSNLMGYTAPQMTRSAARRTNRNSYRLLLALDIEECAAWQMRNGAFDLDSARRFARDQEPALASWVRNEVNWPLVAERMNRDGMRSVYERSVR